MGRPSDWLRLVRAPLAPTAACDAVACALLARGPGLAQGVAPLSLADGALLAATSLLVYAAGMAGNDLADARRDRTIAPDRPIPSGRISRAAAGALVLACAAGAVLLHGGPAGGVVPVAAALGFAALYDLLHARRPLASAPLMGLVRFSNAATAVWPAVLAGTSDPLALLGPLVLGVYSTGITVLSTAEGRPQVPRSRMLLARAGALVAFAGSGVLSMLGAEDMTLLFWGGVLACLAIAFGRVPRPAPVKYQVLEMLLALYYVDAILATGGYRKWEWIPTLSAMLIAQALVIGSQLAIRALRPR